MKKTMQVAWSRSNKDESKNRLKKRRGIHHRRIEKAVKFRFLGYEERVDYFGESGMVFKEVNRVKVKPDNDKETAPPPKK